MKENKKKQQSVNFGPFFLYLIATNPTLMKPIERAYAKFPELYEKAFLQSPLRKDKILDRMTLASTLAMRKGIGFLEVEGGTRLK